MQAHDDCNTMPTAMVSGQDPRHFTRDLSLCVLVNPDKGTQCATSKAFYEANNNNDERVMDDLSYCSDDSSVDERGLLDFWYSEDDCRDDDDSSSSFDLLAETTCTSNDRKHVTFGTVTVREYGLAVGAYSAARDSCPLQMAWEYAPPSVYTVEYYTYFKDFGRKRTLKRLSLEKRRKRIAKVQGVPLEKILQQECESTFATIQDSIRNGTIDHPDLIGDGLFTDMSLLSKLPHVPLKYSQPSL